MTSQLALTAALFGLCVGSFINVVVWRIPRGESCIWPGSHCPKCGKSLAWHQNIPVLSWCLLKGKCAFCSSSISPIYPAVELLSAGLWVLLALPGVGRMGAPDQLLNLLAGAIFVSWLLPLALIDLKTMQLPESLCKWGLITGLLCSAGLGALQGAGAEMLLYHCLAAVLGLLAFESVSAGAERIMGVPALGLGDAKLAALLGAWLGLKGLGAAVALAVLLGAMFGVIGRLSGKLSAREPFPFGPFLAVGGFLSWLACDSFWGFVISPPFRIL
jgi:leader peptidase (prepilin peptidase)/N-methyltransferase